MIAAARRRIEAVLSLAVSGTRRADRIANRQLERAWAPLTRWARRARRVMARLRALAARALRWAARRLRPAVVLLFRLLSRLETGTRRALAAMLRAATRASAVLTPERAICAVILASAACLAVSQFVDYRAVEVGQPGYTGLPGATPPTVGGEPAGQPHLYLLLGVALTAAALAAVVLRTGRSRLGRVVFLLGLASLAVILLVDLPAGLDDARYTSQFSGTTAVLDNGFYAELASTAGLMLGGLLLIAAPKAAARYHARPCRTRTNSFARAARSLRRRRPRRGSSRARVARSA